LKFLTGKILKARLKQLSYLKQEEKSLSFDVFVQWVDFLVGSHNIKNEVVDKNIQDSGYLRELNFFHAEMILWNILPCRYSHL
jgi:hypothetical protein